MNQNDSEEVKEFYIRTVRHALANNLPLRTQRVTDKQRIANSKIAAIEVGKQVFRVLKSSEKTDKPRCMRCNKARRIVKIRRSVYLPSGRVDYGYCAKCA